MAERCFLGAEDKCGVLSGNMPEPSENQQARRPEYGIAPPGMLATFAFPCFTGGRDRGAQDRQGSDHSIAI